AVRPAGHGDANPRVRRDQRVEVAAEAVQQLSLENHPGRISTSVALRLGFGVRLLLLEVGADLSAIDSIELRIGLARLARLSELHQSLAEIIEAVGRALARFIAAVIGEERNCRGVGIALAEQRPTDEIVGVADAAMLGISGGEGFERSDRLIILP